MAEGVPDGFLGVDLGLLAKHPDRARADLTGSIGLGHSPHWRTDSNSLPDPLGLKTYSYRPSDLLDPAAGVRDDEVPGQQLELSVRVVGHGHLIGPHQRRLSRVLVGALEACPDLAMGGDVMFMQPICAVVRPCIFYS